MSHFTVTGVSKEYEDDGATQIILHDVNVEVRPAEFLALMGPSGSGKSTLLRIMAGLAQPTSGEVHNRPRRIGFVFQNFGLMPWLTVEQNIGYGLKMASWPATKSRHIIRTEIERLGLEGLEDSHPKELSGGQKQRVGLARALAIQPDVLILDEAFSALDAYTAESLRQDVLHIWKTLNIPVIMVTHLASEAVQMADRVLVLSGAPGTIREEVEITLPRPRHERTDGFYKLVDRLEAQIKPR